MMHTPAADAAVEAEYESRLARWRAERDARERTERWEPRPHRAGGRRDSAGDRAPIRCGAMAHHCCDRVPRRRGVACARARGARSRPTGRRVVRARSPAHPPRVVGMRRSGDRFRPASIPTPTISTSSAAAASSSCCRRRGRAAGQETLARWLLAPGAPGRRPRTAGRGSRSGRRLPLRERWRSPTGGHPRRRRRAAHLGHGAVALPSRQLAWPLGALSAVNTIVPARLGPLATTERGGLLSLA